MTARPLFRCPTCAGELTPEVREAMGLRTGALLNSLLPGGVGPSDIDHVLHSERTNRVAFFEYKDLGLGARMRGGQRRTYEALRGDWQEPATGRSLSVDYQLLDSHDADAAEDAFKVTIAAMWPEYARKRWAGEDR